MRLGQVCGAALLAAMVASMPALADGVRNDGAIDRSEHGVDDELVMRSLVLPNDDAAASAAGPCQVDGESRTGGGVRDAVGCFSRAASAVPDSELPETTTED